MASSIDIGIPREKKPSVNLPVICVICGVLYSVVKSNRSDTSNDYSNYPYSNNNTDSPLHRHDCCEDWPPFSRGWQRALKCAGTEMNVHVASQSISHDVQTVLVAF